ncbi:Uncharacterised protein [Mycobacteroides abscessus subsp. abscessus]|nr:Uncharacterised protein [Mycobacteroides abscessus subsp. abscessus]
MEISCGMNFLVYSTAPIPSDSTDRPRVRP